MHGLRSVWKAEVRENERMNKTLSLSGERSPNASLELVSARLAIKYKLGASLAVQQTYKSKHDAAERLHQLVCEHWNAKDTVSRNLARWAPPSVADVGMIVLADTELKAAMKRIDPSMSLTKDVVWASAYVSAWQKLLDKKKLPVLAKKLHFALILVCPSLPLAALFGRFQNRCAQHGS